MRWSTIPFFSNKKFNLRKDARYDCGKRARKAVSVLMSAIIYAAAVLVLLLDSRSRVESRCTFSRLFLHSGRYFTGKFAHCLSFSPVIPFLPAILSSVNALCLRLSFAPEYNSCCWCTVSQTLFPFVDVASSTSTLMKL